MKLRKKHWVTLTKDKTKLKSELEDRSEENIQNETQRKKKKEYSKKCARGIRDTEKVVTDSLKE